MSMPRPGAWLSSQIASSGLEFAGQAMNRPIFAAGFRSGLPEHSHVVHGLPGG